jgi:hypothetical protein
MQPIKTTNAMNPAPAKGIQSLPTPVIDDVIITEVVNAWKGDYQKLEYGTMWDSVSHGSQQGSFPGHRLVFQQVSSEDGQWVKRIWVNDRVDQDSYNYTIKYIEGSREHPSFVRTYIVPRDTYVGLEDGSPDPAFPGAVLTEEVVERVEGELDSQYIKVVRVYDTLDGPVVNARALVQTPLGLTPATVSRQDIVNFPLANIEGSLTTVEDTIKAQDSFKAQRDKVVVDQWPTTMGVDYDEQLGLSVFYNQTIVSPSKYNTKSDLDNVEYQPIDQWKSLEKSYDISKITATLNRTYYKFSTGVQVTLPDKLLSIKTYYGQSYGAGKNADFGGSTLSGNVSLSNSASSKSSWSINGDIYFEIEKGFSGAAQGEKHIFFLSIPNGGITNDSILDRLNSLSLYGNSQGIGTQTSNASPRITSIKVVNKTLFIFLNANVNGYKGGDIDVYFTASGIGAVSLTVKGSNCGFNGNSIAIYNTQFPNQNITPVSTGFALIPITRFLNEIVIPGQKYQNWPYLKLKTENLIVVSGSRSLSESTSRSQAIGINGQALNTGTGSSFDVNVNVNSINIPESLHDSITIQEEFIGSYPDDSVGVGQPTYGVRPQTISATKADLNGKEEIVKKFPEGKYLLDTDIQLYKWGFAKITATTVNITADYT